MSLGFRVVSYEGTAAESAPSTGWAKSGEVQGYCQVLSGAGFGIGCSSPPLAECAGSCTTLLYYHILPLPHSILPYPTSLTQQ